MFVFFPCYLDTILSMIFLERAAEGQIRIKDFRVFFLIHGCTCAYAIADMCLGVEFYCSFSKNRFLLQKHNFRLLPGLLGPEWPGTPINRYPPALQDRIVRDPLIAVPANARRCCQVHRHISGGERERSLEWQMNKNLVMSEKIKKISQIFFFLEIH